MGPELAALTKSYGGALLAVAAATIAGLLIAQRWGNEPVVLVYILPVLGAAVYAGLGPAMSGAVASTLAYNYYFTAPYHTFAIHSAADVVTVVILFLVAVVTSRLASQIREQARIAASHAARNASIAGFARHLLTCRDDAEIHRVTVDELAGLFTCNVVMVEGADVARLVASSPVGMTLAPSDLAAAALTLASGEPAGRGIHRINLVDWHFRPIASGQSVLAAVGLAREDGREPISEAQTALLVNLLDQTALALERARLEGEVRDVVKLRERDKIRSGLLASIGEEIKPRLHAISAVARTLKRSGTADKATVTTLSAEATRLERYIDNLVELDPGHEQPAIELGEISIDLQQRRVSRGTEEIHLTPKEFALLAELANHRGRVLGHAHLLRAVWGPAQADQIDYLRVAIRSLRIKLEANPSQPSLILNEPAVGYRLSA